jgi:hypothetical protein
MDLLMDGEVLSQDIDDFVDAWHGGAEDGASSSMELSEFLGMTENEYRLWVEQSESLKYIAAARKANLPVDQLLMTRDQFGVAARSSDQSEARKLLDWLVKTGRVDNASY